MTIHEVKCQQPYFGDLFDGKKTFELRKDDRGYQEGDMLVCREWVPREELGPNGGSYTGDYISFLITYVFANQNYLQPGIVALGLQALHGHRDPFRVTHKV